MQDITPQNREERYQLSKKMVKWSVEQHKRVYYSDESLISIGGGRKYIKIKEDEDPHDE